MLFRTIRNSLRLIIIVYILFRNRAMFFWYGEPTIAKGKNLARALEQLGPTFIKLGQVISTRSDLIGQDIAFALTELQDRVPPFPTKIIHEIIAGQFGKPTSDIFASFEEKPAAAASIAQVHFATLPDGKQVAVKILRPNIEKHFAKDVALFYWLADVAEWWQPVLQRFKLQEVVKSFEDMITRELDLRFEASAAVQLKENTQYDENFYVPEIYWNYTSHRVLTIERVFGIPVNDIAAIKAAGFMPEKIVDIAAICFFKQVFRDGFFHADMHPGNIFILANGGIAVVDFGIMGRLDQRNRIYLAQILHGFLTEDYYNLAKVHFDAGFVPAHKSVDEFALALMAITKPIIGRKLSDISVAKLLGQLFTVAEAFEMEAQPQLLLLHKNMMLTEGVGRMLNPDINMWQVVEPLIEDWARENLGVKAKLKEKAGAAFSLLHHLPNLVNKADSLLAKVGDGGIKLHSETVTRMELQKQKFHRDWLVFAWGSLIVFAIIYFVK